jgi:antitoxin ParD1/3/4
MNVSLSRELERYVQEKIQSGRYSSASEVIREALRSLQEWEARKTGSSLVDQAPKEITR